MIALYLAIMLAPAHYETSIVARIAAERHIPPEDVEVRLWDGSRVDMLDRKRRIAYEADFAAKWAEAVGQSKYYAIVTGYKPGILLLVADPEKEYSLIYRCQTVCALDGIILEVVRLRKEETND